MRIRQSRSGASVSHVFAVGRLVAGGVDGLSAPARRDGGRVPRGPRESVPRRVDAG